MFIKQIEPSYQYISTQTQDSIWVENPIHSPQKKLEERTTISTASLSDFPDEILLKILGYLSNKSQSQISQTSQKMHNIAHDPSLFRNFRIIDCNDLVQRLKNPQYTSYPELTRRLNCAYTIDLSSTDATDDQLDMLLQHCPQLRSLNLFWCDNLTDQALITITKRCPNLQTLDISEIKLGLDQSRTFTNIGFSELQKLKHLKHLNVSWCYNLGPVGMKGLIECKELEDVNFSGCKNISDSEFKELSSLKHLKLLTFSQCRNITNSVLQSIADGCPDLRSLNLSGYDTIPINELTSLWTFKNLEELILSSCDQLTDDDLQNLAQLTNLAALDISWCTQISDVGLRYLADLNLKEINLSYCEDISDEGLMRFKKEHPEILIVK